MELLQFLNLVEKVGLTANVQRTGSADYTRAFLVDADGVTLGRATIFQGEYSHVKWYWREYGDLCESDYFIHSCNHALTTGKPLSREQWRQLVQRAEQLSREDYQRKLQWRRDNPKPERADGKPGKRKKLEGRSARAFIRDLTRGWALRIVRASSYYELRRRWPHVFCIRAERGGYTAILREDDMQTYHVWPDGTTCYAEDLEEYLTFMSDDYVTCTTPDEDLDAVPSYDEIVNAMRRFRDS